ncbi:MAG: hypothetical protein ACI8ZX_000239 [Planctomycetota bacterium]|jgi:hypothetical protein
MEKLLLIGAFLLLRYFITSSFKKKTNKPAKTSGKNKNLDDILGDFMKKLEQKAEPQATPITVSSDTHKAEADTPKKLDWQEVTTSRFAEKKQLLKHSDHDKISHANENMKTDEFYDSKEDESTFEFEEIDLRKAVLYKEILDRKYFTI